MIGGFSRVTRVTQVNRKPCNNMLCCCVSDDDTLRVVCTDSCGLCKLARKYLPCLTIIPTTLPYENVERLLESEVAWFLCEFSGCGPCLVSAKLFRPSYFLSLSNDNAKRVFLLSF